MTASERAAKWKVANRERYRETTTMLRAKKKVRLEELKEQTPCTDCGRHFPAVCMDYHHLDSSTKTMNVAKAIERNYSWSRLMKEIEKCVLLCACCHRIRHYGVVSKSQKLLQEAS